MFINNPRSSKGRRAANERNHPWLDADTSDTTFSARTDTSNSWTKRSSCRHDADSSVLADSIARTDYPARAAAAAAAFTTRATPTPSVTFWLADGTEAYDANAGNLSQ